MEVTHVRDHVTHAVVGGMAAEACGIADTAEFFHVLSSTLYSRKEEAVIREVLCNGWDAHIDAGILTIPLEVTLTDDKLIIRDFGDGISRAMIQPIYGVYGSSTKKQNVNVTGGFGLGSKAPWAYVDHFQVTSCHQGTKTIYSMSKSSAQVMGKPMITPLVEVPTDDSGLEVSINLKSPSDKHKFHSLIVRIAALGEMQVKLNGEMLPTVPFSKAEHGYLLFKQGLIDSNTSHKLFVRYGNVVYPIERHDEYYQLYDKAMKRLEMVNGSGYYGSTRDHWVVALMAKPNTISVTPSRESLSMTEHTIATLTELIKSFVEETKGKIETECHRLLVDVIDKAWLTDSPASLLTSTYTLPNASALPTSPNTKFLSNMTDLTSTYMRRSYPSFDGFHEADIKRRLDALVKGRFGNKKIIRSLRAAYNCHGNKITDRYGRRVLSSNWMHKHLLWPVMKRMRKFNLNPQNLYVYSKVLGHRYGGGPGFTSPADWRRTSVEDCMPFARGLVFVAYNRAAVIERANDFPALDNWFGEALNSLAYFVPRNPTRVKDAISYFEKMGLTVFDLTKYHSWEEAPPPPAPRAKVVKPKKPAGYPLLSTMLRSGRLSTDGVYEDGAPRGTNPKFVITQAPREKLEGILNFSAVESKAIIRLYGDQGVVTRNSAQANNLVLKKNGILPLKEFLLKELIELYKNDPLIESYYRNGMLEESELLNDYLPIVKAIIMDEKLAAKFKLPKPPTQITLDRVRIMDHFLTYNRYEDWHKEIRALVTKWEYSDPAKALFKLVRKNRYAVEMLQGKAITPILNPLSTSPDELKNTARTIILATLKG